jgi:hypothetical protein
MKSYLKNNHNYFAKHTPSSQEKLIGKVDRNFWIVKGDFLGREKQLYMCVQSH